MKPKQLELEIAIKNLQTFSSIKKYDRMTVNNNNYYVTIDTRYAQSIRRWYNDDSRKDLIQPIKLTYNRAIDEYLNGNLSYNTILNSLNNLFNVCVFTYQDYTELHKLIMDLRAKLEVIEKKSVKQKQDYYKEFNYYSTESNTSNDNELNVDIDEFDIESQENSIEDEEPNTFWYNLWNKSIKFVNKYIIKPIIQLFKNTF